MDVPWPVLIFFPLKRARRSIGLSHDGCRWVPGTVGRAQPTPGKLHRQKKSCETCATSVTRGSARGFPPSVPAMLFASQLPETAATTSSSTIAVSATTLRWNTGNCNTPARLRRGSFHIPIHASNARQSVIFPPTWNDAGSERNLECVYHSVRHPEAFSRSEKAEGPCVSFHLDAERRRLLTSSAPVKTTCP